MRKQITFNTAISQITPSASVALMEQAKQMVADGVDLVNLTGGEPDFPTPAPIVETACAEIRKGNTHYVAGKGLPALRQRLATELAERDGISCTAEQILITPGGKFAIYLAVRALVNEGDEVLYLEPGWVSYPSIVIASGGVPVPVCLRYEDNYRVTRELLESCVTPRSKLLIINTPNNPTGRVLSAEETGIIADFVKEHDLILISDEIYSRIIYGASRHISPASLPDIAGQVITINGFSKFAAMTGWRLGYMCMPAEIYAKVMKLYQHTMTCVSGFSQAAAITALDCRDEAEQMRQSYGARRNLFIDRLNAIDGVEARMPEGAFYAWVHFDLPGMDSYAICKYLQEQALVAGVPGDSYGGGGAQCVRFCFASPEQKLLAAAERIEKAVKKLKHAE